MTSVSAGHIILTPTQPVTQELFSRSRALYRMSYCAPHFRNALIIVYFYFARVFYVEATTNKRKVLCNNDARIDYK